MAMNHETLHMRASNLVDPYSIYNVCLYDHVRESMGHRTVIRDFGENIRPLALRLGGDHPPDHRERQRHKNQGRPLPHLQ